jgi:hypothetical protein
MGIAAYNRGSRSIARDADALMPLAINRADRQAHKDEIERLQAQVADLTRDLARARRCLAAERLGRESLRLRLATAERIYAFAVGTLCRCAWPLDATGRPTVWPTVTL